MKEFPSNLTPKNCHLFSQMKFNIILENWREKIFQYLLNGEKNGVYLGDENNVQVDKRIADCLRLELVQLGWTTTLAYNNTILFIYDNENEIEKYKYSLCEEVIE